MRRAWFGPVGEHLDEALATFEARARPARDRADFAQALSTVTGLSLGFTCPLDMGPLHSSAFSVKDVLEAAAEVTGLDLGSEVVGKADTKRHRLEGSVLIVCRVDRTLQRRLLALGSASGNLAAAAAFTANVVSDIAPKLDNTTFLENACIDVSGVLCTSPKDAKKLIMGQSIGGEALRVDSTIFDESPNMIFDKQRQGCSRAPEPESPGRETNPPFWLLFAATGGWRRRLAAAWPTHRSTNVCVRTGNWS